MTQRDPWKDRYSFVDDEDGRPVDMPVSEWSELIALECAILDEAASPKDMARYEALQAKMPDRVGARVLEMVCARRFYGRAGLSAFLDAHP